MKVLRIPISFLEAETTCLTEEEQKLDQKVLHILESDASFSPQINYHVNQLKQDILKFLQIPEVLHIPVPEREEDITYHTLAPLYEQDTLKVLQIPDVLHIPVPEREENIAYLAPIAPYQQDTPKVLQIPEVL
ncbi:hypothetical protein AMTR_s00141p00083020 [Amborella trichopoda]|uniref:Uncharacterized protein n=1 Tax=Amborella trichopoda TaxID=13333 RepID=W1PH30_AMBTC|nr:hypothetical protein AMTR_s00141p00083020 [Amborella trichopoda]